MRKWIGILVCLMITASVSAVVYHPMRPESYRAAVHVSVPGYQSSSDFRSTSSYLSSRPSGAITSYSSNGLSAHGLAAISASNFDALNSEGGACYQPSATQTGSRKGRPGGGGDSGGGAIGEYDFHSPVGDTPWVWMLLLLAAFGMKKKRSC